MRLHVTSACHFPSADLDSEPDPKIVGKRLDASCWTLDIGMDFTLFVHTPAQAFALREAAAAILDSMAEANVPGAIVAVIR